MRDFLALSEGRSRGKSAAAMRIPMNLARSIQPVIQEEEPTVQSRWNLIRDNIPRKVKRNNSIKRSRSAKSKNKDTRKSSKAKANRRLSNTSKRQYNGGKKKSRKRHKSR